MRKVKLAVLDPAFESRKDYAGLTNPPEYAIAYRRLARSQKLLPHEGFLKSCCLAQDIPVEFEVHCAECTGQKGG